MKSVESISVSKDEWIDKGIDVQSKFYHNETDANNRINQLEKELEE